MERKRKEGNGLLLIKFVVFMYYCLQCRFVEVKGEKDKLSMKQKMWLDYLRKVGAEIDVCLVHSEYFCGLYFWV